MPRLRHRLWLPFQLRFRLRLWLRLRLRFRLTDEPLLLLLFLLQWQQLLRRSLRLLRLRLYTLGYPLLYLYCRLYFPELLIQL